MGRTRQRKEHPEDDLFDGLPSHVQKVWHHANRLKRDRDRQEFKRRKTAREQEQRNRDDAQFR